MNLGTGRFVGAGRDDAVNQVRFDKMADFRLESFLVLPWALMEIDDLVAGMVRLKGASQELGSGLRRRCGSQ